MKLLLDECVPRKFKNHLPGHECQTVPEAGLGGKKNGELLSLAESAASRYSSRWIEGLSMNKTCGGDVLGLF